VLGTGPDTERVVEEIRRRSAGNLRLAGVLSARREEVGQEVAGCEILGHVSELRGPVADLKVDSIVIALDEKDRALLSAEVLFRCKDAGIAVLDTRDFHQIAARTARPAKAMEPA
ncbi:MAG: hypothetical protein O7J95_04850, partial [Planctomycetota bacterium]|nr:hypothetical protein [Planctomycetota bacterium]